MATFEITAPDGRVFEVTGPSGSTKEQALEKIKAQYQPETKEVGAVDRYRAGAAGLNRGLSGLLGLPVDTAENVANLAKAGFGTVATMAGRPDMAPELTTGTPGGSKSISGLLNRIGIRTENPNPQDPASQMLYTGGTIAGGSMVPGAGVRPTLAAAAGGALAEQVDPRLTPLGAMVPGAAGQAGRELKTAVAARTQPNVDAFNRAGTSPSVGQATESTFFRGLESLLAKFPGGNGVMQRFIEKQQADMGKTAKTGVSAEDAGREIEKGVTGFIGRTKVAWQALDQQVASKLPPNSTFAPSNTIKALDDLTVPVAGAEQTTGALVNPKIAEMKANFTADLQANNGQMPYEAIRNVRTRIGSMLDNALVSGVPGGELKRLYGALSKDMEAAANAAGAGKEFARQNQYYAARMDRIENVLDRVLGKTPEETFNKFLPKDPNQVNTARSVLRSLKPDERAIIAEAVVNRFGRATPGRQNDVGDVFSSETFLTNWNRMSPSAKAQLFPDSDMRSNLEAIAKASSNLREGSKVFANPSGTAGTAAAYGIASSPYVGLATGSFSPLIAAGGLVGSSYIGAKMLTNPKVVEWLARAPKIAPDRAAAHLARLGVIVNESKDEALKQELSSYINSIAAPPQ